MKLLTTEAITSRSSDGLPSFTFTFIATTHATPKPPCTENHLAEILSLGPYSSFKLPLTSFVTITVITTIKFTTVAAAHLCCDCKKFDIQILWVFGVKLCFRMRSVI
jgi:hypothetical protein